jgi:hypothetical protein
MSIPVKERNTVALRPIKYPRDEFLDFSCITAPKNSKLCGCRAF